MGLVFSSVCSSVLAPKHIESRYGGGILGMYRVHELQLISCSKLHMHNYLMTRVAHMPCLLHTWEELRLVLYS